MRPRVFLTISAGAALILVALIAIPVAGSSGAASSLGVYNAHVMNTKGAGHGRPFGSKNLSFRGGSVQTAPAPGNAWSLNTTGMQPCGYVMVVTTVDRAIINSGAVGHWASKAVGFCVRKPGG